MNPEETEHFVAEASRLVENLDDATVAFLANHPAVFKKLIGTGVLKAQQQFDFVCQLNKCEEYIVNGHLSAKYFPPPQLKWYMEKEIQNHKGGGLERNVSAQSHYHTAKHTAIYPCPELIERCAKNQILMKPMCIDKKRLNIARKIVRSWATNKDVDGYWTKHLPSLKKTSYIIVSVP